MSNSSSPAPMYGAPQTPTPVPVPQAIAEESVVTSCYGQDQARGYDPPPAQQQAVNTNHHGNYQQQHQHYQQQQQHAGYQQSQPQGPLYHPPGQYHGPQGPQYHNPGPGPVAVVQFSAQHPQPQAQPQPQAGGQQQGHYQQVHITPQTHPPQHINSHYLGSGQQMKPSTLQYQHHDQHSSPARPELSMAPPSSPSGHGTRPQYYNMTQHQARPNWVTVRQHQPGMVRVVKPGPVQVQQPQRQIQVPQVQVQQPAGQSLKPVLGVQRPLVIRQSQPLALSVSSGQDLHVIRPQPGTRTVADGMMVRRMVPGSPQAAPRPLPAVHLTPGGYVQQPVQRPPHVISPQRQGTPRQAAVSVRPGVIQQTDQSHQSHQSHQFRQRYPQPAQSVMVPNQQHWRPAPAQQQPQRRPTPVMAAQPVQRQVVRPALPQHNSNAIAYDVEHVFKEDGKEVRKMPVLINGETVWVKIVPNDASVKQQESEILMALGLEENVETGSAVTISSADSKSNFIRNSSSSHGSNTKNLTTEQRNQIIAECVDDHISPVDLAKKYSVNADTIRAWIRKAGKTLPKTYKKSIYPTDGQNQIRGGTPGKPVVNHHTITEAAKATIMREVLEEHISPNELSRKYSIPAYAIRDWVKKAGHRLPKSYKRTLKNTSGQGQTNYQLPTAPLPPGQIGVAVGEPPAIDSPPGLEVRSSISSTASSNGSLHQSPAAIAPKRIPGKLALCNWCAFQSEDLAKCGRCHRKLDAPKILDDPSYKPKPDSTEVVKKALRDVRVPNKNRKRNNAEEPLCIDIDSEDENAEETIEAETIEDDSGDGVPTDTNIMDVSGQWCSLPCRSIRIGSYKVLPKERISVTEKGVQIRVPGIVNPSEVVVISIPMKDILKVLAHFGKSMPLLFLYVTPSACQKARKLLKMTNSQSFYFDVQSQDDTQKRITILPEKLTEENKMILKQHFSGKVQELESKDANEILVRSSPKDIPMLKSKMLGGQPGGSGGEKKGGEVSVVKYCQYPPDMAGNLTITNDDYSCLEAEQFLNDVIIDFYLKYLQFGKFTNKQEVMNRTHIFTTFFYKRLTTRPAHNKGKSHPIEDDPHLSAAEKRYKRVERWIKKINLFEKDFIVVPINEHAHWFVCVICYPGQMGCVNAETGEKCETPASQARSRGNRTKRKTVKKPMTIGSTTIIPLKGKDDIKFMEEEGSDRDEAEASDDEVEEDEEEAIKKTEQEIQAKLAIKQPCILTFDSLAGGSKARTHQTLREYLSCEWKTKMVAAGKEERVFTKDNMPGGSPKVQQQPNFSDCGIYLLQYVESFFKDPIIDYTLPIKSLTQWFTKEEVENKRNDIAVLIRELAAAQNPGKELTFPSLNFHNPPEDESDEDDDEDYEDGGAQVKGRTPNVQIVSGVGENRLIRLSNGATGSRIVMTPPSKGKFLIQKTGNQVKMSPYTTTSIPPGVTVTPSAPLRQIPSNNISVRTVSVRGNSETVQTSPDSTSQETDNIDSNTLEARTEDESGESDQSITVPDSQSQTEVGQIKRPADIGFDEMQGKRIKSDTES